MIRLFFYRPLDRFIHDIVRIGMIEELCGQRSETAAYLRFQVSMQTVVFSRSNPTEQEWLDWFDNEIRVRHSWQSFQRADRIAEAVRLISEIKLWEEVAKALGKDVRSVKSQLDLVIDRRDKIAHEADIVPTPTQPGKRWNIDVNMTREAIDFIIKISETIYKILANSNVS